MQSKNVKLIFLREVRDQLRDRRTLFMVAVLPLLLYPALGIGMAQMLTTFSEQTRTVAVIGVDDLPDPPLLDATSAEQRFRPIWFADPEDASKLRVVTDAMLDSDSAESLSVDESGFLREAMEEYRPVIEDLGQITRRIETLETTGATTNDAGEETAEFRQLVADEDRLKREINTWFRSGPCQVLIAIPRDFRERLDEINQGLLRRESVDELIDNSPRPVILQNTADEKSMIAARRVREAVRTWNNRCWRNGCVRPTSPRRSPAPSMRLASTSRPRKRSPPRCGARCSRSCW